MKRYIIKSFLKYSNKIRVNILIQPFQIKQTFFKEPELLTDAQVLERELGVLNPLICKEKSNLLNEGEYNNINLIFKIYISV